jgi:lysophospholipase L1-like esterase
VLTTTPARLFVPLLTAALLAGCSVLGGGTGGGSGGDRAAAPSGGAPSATASPAPPGEPSAVPSPRRPMRGTYVAVGASETAGVGADDPARQAWPRVLHDTALPSTRYVNLGIPGATVATATARELPRALAAEPRIATVWLNVNDLTSLVPVDRYERELRALVHGLRRGGATDVLVANSPPLERLPVYRACLPAAPRGGPACRLPITPAPDYVRAAVAAYNAAVARVVQAEGAVLVDLHAAGLRRADLTGLTAADGFHPSTEGHRVVAATFAQALREAKLI